LVRISNSIASSKSVVTANPLANDMLAGINRLQKAGNAPDLIVDLGAAKGSWTHKAIKVWSDALYELVEPIGEQINRIPEDLKENPKVRITEAVAGSAAGKVDLTLTPDLDGSGIYGGEGENIRNVKVITVDDLIKDKPGDVLLKLDTHGYELPIFEGAKETLKRTQVVIVEVYGFHVAPTGKLFHEISDYLLKRGFRLYDIVDIMRRAKDQAFWQADAIYLREDHPVFSENSYK
jgi:FkbM family methyltransferase